MNPLLVEALGSVVRAGLNVIAGWLVAHGIWTATASEKYVGAAALALISIGWSIWQKHGMRSKLVTAMAMPPGVSENQVQAVVKDRSTATPPVTLAKDAIPDAIWKTPTRLEPSEPWPGPPPPPPNKKISKGIG